MAHWGTAQASRVLATQSFKWPRRRTIKAQCMWRQVPHGAVDGAEVKPYWVIGDSGLLMKTNWRLCKRSRQDKANEDGGLLSDVDR